VVSSAAAPAGVGALESFAHAAAVRAALSLAMTQRSV